MMDLRKIEKPIGVSLIETIVRKVKERVPVLEKYRRLVDEKYLNAAEGCIRCVSCKMHHAEYNKGIKWGELCPSGSYFKFESYFALGRLDMIVGLIRGELTWTEGLLNSLYSCTTCGACNEICDFMQEINPPGVELELDEPPRPLDVIEEFKAVGVIEGVGPLPAQKIFGERIEKVHNPYGEPHEKRMAWWPEDLKRPPAKAKLMYFVGCTSSYRQIKIAQATVRIFDKLGLEFGVTPDEVCCGSPAFRSGQRSIGLKTLKRAVEVMAKAGAEKVVTSCAGCYRTLKRESEKYGIEVPFEVVHTMDILRERMNEIEFKREWRETVTYHDPCHMGRHMGYYETPREVLRRIPGLKLVEMHRNRRWAWCCGAGGGVKAAFPKLALWAAGERLWEAQDVGATSIVSICPFCNRNLSDAVPLVSPYVNIKVYDVTEIVWDTIKD
jgi:heterodisulfide reductase subunit D